MLKYLAQNSGWSIEETNYSLNTELLLFSGYLVFLMQAGFVMVSRIVPPILASAVATFQRS